MIRITIRGITFECDSEQEALRLAGAVETTGFAARNGLSQEKKKGPGRPPRNGKAIHVVRSESANGEAIDFLKAVKDSSPGLSSDRVVSILKLKHGRGIGGAIGKIKRIIASKGLDPNQVFLKRGDERNRRWKAQPMIAEAIEKLEANGKVS